MTLYADLETSTKLIDGRVNCYLWGLLSEDDTVKEYGVNLTSFFDYLIQLEGRTHQIYFHNLSWDGVFLTHWLVDNDYKFVPQITKQTRNKCWTWICDANTNIYKIVVRVNSKKRFIFLDSLKILTLSVKKLGKNLGLEKLSLEYEKHDYYEKKEDVPAEVVEYLFRDITIPRAYINKLDTQVEAVKPTIASTVLNDFEKFYGENNFRKDFGSRQPLRNILTLEEWENVKRSYRGGFTNFSPRYEGVDIKLDNTGVSYDWNSMYPSIMLNQRVPYGKPLKQRQNETDLELLEVRILNANKKYAFLPAMIPNISNGRQQGHWLDNISDATFWVWKDEFEIIKQAYDMEYLIVSRMYFKSKFVFKQYIDMVKDRKVKAKNEADRTIAKVIQNSLYGKFGQNIIREQKILKFDDTHILKGKRYGTEGNWVEVKETTQDEYLPYIPVASYITSAARCLLFKAIIDNKDTFIYCDTDSLYLTNEGVNLPLDDNEYGCLKVEHRFDRFKVIKPKCYMLHDTVTNENVVKVSGLPEAAQQKLTFDTFYSGYIIDDEKLQKKHYNGGLILETIQYKL